MLVKLVEIIHAYVDNFEYWCTTSTDELGYKYMCCHLLDKSRNIPHPRLSIRSREIHPYFSQYEVRRIMTRKLTCLVIFTYKYPVINKNAFYAYDHMSENDKQRLGGGGGGGG